MTRAYHLIRDKVTSRFDILTKVYIEGISTKKSMVFELDGRKHFMPYEPGDKLVWAMEEARALSSITKSAKTIIFSAEQAQVFTSVHKNYTESLDFRLPFGHTFIQFDKAVRVPYSKRHDMDYDRGHLIAVALRQTEMSREEFNENIERHQRLYELLDASAFVSNINLKGETAVLNQVCFLYEDMGTEYLTWQSGQSQEFLDTTDDDRRDVMVAWKNVAIACVGYINCENINLHKENDIPESVNAKRERKGKSRLEPYYVCRIRGVQYDNAGNPTGEGAKHSIRYDVRGHFRRLTTGKTTWVRPHQRGLENELYIPKTYLVDRKEPAK